MARKRARERAEAAPDADRTTAIEEEPGDVQPDESPEDAARPQGARYLPLTMEELLRAGNDAQARAQQSATGHAIRCPRCNCADTRVWYTRADNGRIKRIRVCRHCAKRILTYEAQV